MRRVGNVVLRGLLLCLAVVPVTSGQASASPVFQRCAKTIEANTGNWKDGKCSMSGTGNWIRVGVPGNNISSTEECAAVVEPHTGNFLNGDCAQKFASSEWIRVEKMLPLFSTSSTEVSELSVATSKISCTSSVGQGQISGEDGISKLVMKYTGCKTGGLFSCSTPGAAEGEIVTSSLAGELGYVESATKKVGVLFKPEAGEEFTKGEISCVFSIKVKVRGGLIGEVTPVNTYSTTSTLLFSVVAEKQRWTEITIKEVAKTAQLEASINGGAFQPARLQSTEKTTTEEAFNIQA